LDLGGGEGAKRMGRRARHDVTIGPLGRKLKMKMKMV
jgi:hypothetical protein